MLRKNVKAVDMESELEESEGYSMNAPHHELKGVPRILLYKKEEEHLLMWWLAVIWLCACWMHDCDLLQHLVS